MALALNVLVNVLTAVLASTSVLFFCLGGKMANLPAALREFHATWAAWPPARRIVRLGIALTAWLGGITLNALLQRFLFGDTRWRTEVLSSSLYMTLLPAIAFVMSPYMQAQRGQDAAKHPPTT